MKKQKKSNKAGLVSILIILILIVTNQIFGGNLYNFAFESNKVNSTYTTHNHIYEDITLEESKLNVLFLYVGQADCTFIQKGNYNMMIDAGNSADGENVVDFLKHIGVNKLDYFIGTHSDEDHIGGATTLLKDIKVDKVYTSPVGSGKNYYDSMISLAKSNNIDIIFPELNEIIPFGDVELIIKSAEKYEGISSNNSSIAIQLTYENNKFLFMGDCEKEVEGSHIWSKVDVLKVGHHGSNTSSTEEFLNQVKPHFAVISAGKNNKYRLPNKYTIKRLEEIEANIVRTDINESSFLFTSDGTNIVETEVNINLDSNIE